MAKSNRVVATFLDKEAQKLMPLRVVILKLKKAECKRQGLDFDGWTNTQAEGYYVNRVEETHYSADQTLLTECSPRRELPGISQELLGLTFHLEKHAAICHEDLKQYSVRNVDSGTVSGMFYLDLNPRETKYRHTACFGL